MVSSSCQVLRSGVPCTCSSRRSYSLIGAGLSPKLQALCSMVDPEKFLNFDYALVDVQVQSSSA